MSWVDFYEENKPKSVVVMAEAWNNQMFDKDKEMNVNAGVG